MQSDMENNLLIDNNTPNNIQNNIIDTTNYSYLKSHPLKISLFIIQVILSLGIITFSLIQISIIPEEEDKSVYFSLVSGLVGYWLPSPKSKLKKPT
mgnify:CR=1 FL=1